MIFLLVKITVNQATVNAGATIPINSRVQTIAVVENSVWVGCDDRLLRVFEMVHQFWNSIKFPRIN